VLLNTHFRVLGYVELEEEKIRIVEQGHCLITPALFVVRIMTVFWGNG
jgi:hypothetical protein